MKHAAITRSPLGRLPAYLRYLKSPLISSDTVSATLIAKALNLGEVQVRKDLNDVSEKGKTKIGYSKTELIRNLKNCLGLYKRSLAVIVGAGKLGKALMGFEVFSAYGIEIGAAFDSDKERTGNTISGKPIYPVEELRFYCQMHDIRIGVITVPEAAAQKVCDIMTDAE